MGNTPEQELSIAAAAKRLEAERLLKEADRLERKALIMRMPRVMFEVHGGRTLTVTQAQLHFIHTKAFAMETGDVHVVRQSGDRLMVTAGDLRWLIDEVADVIVEQGFDPFDSDWVTK